MVQHLPILDLFIFTGFDINIFGTAILKYRQESKL